MKDQTLIETTCRSTSNYQLCLSTLLANPRSATADVAELGLIIVDAVKAKTETALSGIEELKWLHPELTDALEQCSNSYKAVLKADVPEAVAALTRGVPKFAEFGMVDAAWEAEICEGSFGRVAESPLSDVNRDLHDLAVGSSDMQNQLVCGGCRTVLLYPRGASNVCCAICNVVTPVPPAGMEMAQLICGGCRTLLMHAQGAASVRCSCCHTVNLVPAAAAPNNVAHVNCGNCHTMLMYPAGAPSVKCAICHFITNVNTGDRRVPIPLQRPAGFSTSASTPSTSTVTARSQSQTVVVQNPMTLDESGKLVSNVVVGVTT
ncbi:UNVERIFIED_CONTAM: protein LSD1 [Sesamum calycinum]|uniref:Protein LSD1 n=1 Tax=Sesamum calycinum TaxID=2727403 RepID=A0AAW2Q7E1_9LAMI